MLSAILISTLAAPILAGLALIVRERRKLRRAVATSEVCRQYAHLFRGGYLSEAAVQSARAALEAPLARGAVQEAEAALRPGRQFAAQARALCEIGTDAAREVLERQLERPVGGDPLEQGWYRLDLARCLRKLNRLASIPPLVRAAAGPEAPLIHFLAAEAACFPGFAGFMYQLDQPIGRSALLVLLRALRGLRYGVEPRAVGAGRLGEALSILWDQRLDGVGPSAVRVFVEMHRLLARAGHVERWFGPDEEGRDAFRAQIELMEALADVTAGYLDLARDQLLDRLKGAAPEEQAEILAALADLRVDTAGVVVPLLDRGALAARDQAIASLAHTADKSVGPWLCRWVWRNARPGRRPGPAFPYLAVLRVLRHFPSAEAESVLLDATRCRDVAVRAAALGSLGWWVPLNPAVVLRRLRKLRFDRSAVVMSAAQAALARLGERHALRWFRQQLAGEQADPIHRVIQLVAEEGILLLWPDLDRLADAEDGDIALHAREALEQLSEDLSSSAQPK